MKTYTTIAAGLVGRLRTAMKQSIQGYVFMALGSLLMVHALPAQVTYQYTGNNFTTVTSDGAYSTSNHVTATLVLNAALPKNKSFFSLPPGQLVSLMMSDGENTLTQDSAAAEKYSKKLFTVIFLSTDKKRNISAWNISEVIPDGLLIQTTNSGGAEYDAGAKDRTIKTWKEGYNRKQPGKWVMH